MAKRKRQTVAPKKTASRSKSRAVAEPESSMSQFEKVDEIKVGGIRCHLSLQSNKEKPLPLYGIVKEGTEKVSCYVEAVDGEAFQITYFFDNTSMPKRASLFMGGQYMRDQYTLAGCSSRTIYRAALPDSGWRALTFAKPTTSGDDSNASIVKDQAKLADFGVVELKFEGLISCKYTQRRDVPSTFTDKSPEACVIHEQNKKAIGSLDVTLGALLPPPKTGGDYAVIENPDAKPCIFRFACLSRLGLQLKGLVPHEEEEIANDGHKRAREQALLEQEESQLLERVERIKRKRASLDAAESRSNEASSSSQVIVKPDPGRMLFDFKTGGCSIEDPLIVDDSD
ncbi:hypothetical protein A4X13_0g3737 [Tilletia indica]|uniref:Uncharacterized protein n=1 Tax=Tilletia indica TaxID=43049 RepID=A0A177TBE9_9BASI|nr:hypothetical protein A4X13_0g3737 [Tilletia indica]